ncbi:hypothetical protein HEP87_56685 [Streptomyces sp. S1D4-11]
MLLGMFAGALELAITWVTVQVDAQFPISRDAGWTSPWVAASSGGLIAGLVGGLTGRIPSGLIGASIGAVGAAIASWDPHDPYTWQLLAAGLVYGFVGGLMGELASGLAARRAGGEPLAERRRSWRWGASLLGVAVSVGYSYTQTLDYSYPQQMLPMAVALACFFAVAGGLAAGQGARQNQDVLPAANIRWLWDWGGVLIGLGGGLAVIVSGWTLDVFHLGLSQGLAAELTGMTGDSYFGSTHAAGALSVYCLVGCITYGIKGASADLTQAQGPAALLDRDRHTFRRLGWVTALAVAFVVGLAVWCASSPELGASTVEEVRWQDMIWVMTTAKLMRALVTGAMVGIVVGLAVAWNQTAWGPFMVARGYLALSHRLPLRLMTFLADAHEQRGVLRQSGAVFQFRHIELQRHLAADARGEESSGRAPLRRVT